MQFIRTEIPDVVICEPIVHGDERGYFVETFRADKLEEFLGFSIIFCQDNESKSSKGVLRGLHYQLPPHAQTKLVRVIQGRVLDVAVDIRKNSPTFGKYFQTELSSDNGKVLIIPKGLAHGFKSLEDNTNVTYMQTSCYAPNNDFGIKYDSFGFDWECENPKLSDRDLSFERIENFKTPFTFGEHK